MGIFFSICGVLGVGGVMSYFWQSKLKKIESKAQLQREEAERKQQAIEKGLQAVLRALIINNYNKYMERGEIPIYERENTDHLYTEYKALGGNGVIESLIEKLADLPTPRK